MSLKLENVTKRFGAFTAVDDLSLEIPSNGIYGFLGANGAGKTTTFRMILGLLDPSKGSIRWEGRPINYETSPYIGYLPEERGLYPKLKAKDQVVYLARLRGMDKISAEKEWKKWLDRFQVLQYEKKRVEELSKGNQQKIQFITAVLHKPKLLILDEPFSGLDPLNVELLKEAVHDLNNSGTTIVFSSHRMEHVEELCEHICIMQKGSMVLSGSLREIKRSFGKKNISITADFSLDYLKEFPGVLKWKKTSEGALLQVEAEKAGQPILESLIGKGVVRKFSIEEPSLNDIFIEKVGLSYE